MPHIWSTEIKELEKLLENLKGQIPDLEKELGQLIRSDDPNVILLYSRRCLEVLIIDLCEKELKRPRKTEPLKGIIDKLHHEEKVPEHIITSMHGLNDLSTFGTHPKEFDQEQVRPVLINLATIVKWYMKFRNIEIQQVSEIKEHITDEPVQEREAKYEQKIQFEKGETTPGKKYSRTIFYLAAILVILIIGFIGGKLFLRQKKINYARYELLPQIQKLVDENFTPPGQAFNLASEDENYIPDDSTLINLWLKIAAVGSLHSQPEGATVLWKDYERIEEPWQTLGTTPLENIRIPFGFKRIKIEKD